MAKKLVLFYVGSHAQLADIFTKGLLFPDLLF